MRVALRVNPSYELTGSGMKMGGGAKPFGIDQEQAVIVARLRHGEDAAAVAVDQVVNTEAAHWALALRRSKP